MTIESIDEIINNIRNHCRTKKKKQATIKQLVTLETFLDMKNTIHTNWQESVVFIVTIILNIKVMETEKNIYQCKNTLMVIKVLKLTWKI